MRTSLCLISSLYLMSAPLMAQTSAPHTAGAGSCVDVTVNGHPALSYACLNQQLAASSQVAQGPQPQLDAVTHAPSNQQVGQFNFSALSIRMGNNLGKSAYPQRPPPPPAIPIFGAAPVAH
jgi:hypothetical protein